jgi:UTP-glucose-1-phosphate uridylyltransferase
VPESGLATCGVLTGKWVDGRLAVTELAEKPTVRYAQEHLRTPNIDGYAGSFGMHVMPPRFFEILGDRGEVSFHQAVDQLRREVPFYGVPIQGQRWDLGTPSSYLECLSAMSERKFQH